MTGPVDSYVTWVQPNYRLFGLFDPTCEEVGNFDVAIRTASAEVVGWGANAVVVNVVSDLVEIAVHVEVWSDDPGQEPGPQAPELIRERQLAFPGGQLSIPESADEQLRHGLEIPTGPGTYRVRVAGFDRARARHAWNSSFSSAGSFSAAASQALRGVEHYRFQLWRISMLSGDALRSTGS
jgi:hypothetical protein